MSPAKVDLDKFSYRIRYVCLPYLILHELSFNPTHGYKLRQVLCKDFFCPHISTFYDYLHQLEELGYLISEDVKGTKTYYVTVEGKIAEKKMRKTIVSFLKGIVYEPKL